MKTYNCLIVDDEAGAHAVLKNYIGRLKHLNLQAQAFDAFEAGEIIKQQQIDIIFLDINMPEMSGLEFIITLQNAPKVILTTAYSEFALDAYDLGVVDYLIKPIPYNRFLKCIHKILNVEESIPQDVINQTLSFKIDGRVQSFECNDILYFQALGNYIKIVTKGKSYLTILTMQDLEKRLPLDEFVRIHKSYIVPKLQLNNHENYQSVNIETQIIPIGRSYKVVVQKLV